MKTLHRLSVERALTAAGLRARLKLMDDQLLIYRCRELWGDRELGKALDNTGGWPAVIVLGQETRDRRPLWPGDRE